MPPEPKETQGQLSRMCPCTKHLGEVEAGGGQSRRAGGGGVPVCTRAGRKKCKGCVNEKALWPALFSPRVCFCSPPPPPRGCVWGHGGEGEGWVWAGKDDRKHWRPLGSSEWAGFLTQMALGTPEPCAGREMLE